VTWGQFSSPDHRCIFATTDLASRFVTLSPVIFALQHGVPAITDRTQADVDDRFLYGDTLNSGMQILSAIRVESLRFIGRCAHAVRLLRASPMRRWQAAAM